MSQFDTRIQARYAEKLRIFLRLRKKDFKSSAGLKPEVVGRKGRLPRYPTAAIAALEAKANVKAARGETEDTSLGERIGLACDYQGWSCAELARRVGVSREIVRRWQAGLNRPNNLTILAGILEVPLAWLNCGGAANLPANSHIGVRLGNEAKNYREKLYGLTTQLMHNINDEITESQMQAHLEHVVMSQSKLADLARRAGGRWQLLNGVLQFAPWISIPERGLARRFWSDDVETIIREELESKPSVCGAWSAVRQRCDERGLAYPQKISLYKRLQNDREQANTYGIKFAGPC